MDPLHQIAEVSELRDIGREGLGRPICLDNATRHD